jgi:hypothetical protein
MAIDHSGHTHPATSAARAACRKGQAPALGAPRTDQASSELARSKARKNTGGDELLAKREELNAKRLRATQAKAATMQGHREECFVCGSRAAWVQRSNSQPVCIKHVVWDDAKIIPV